MSREGIGDFLSLGSHFQKPIRGRKVLDCTRRPPIDLVSLLQLGRVGLRVGVVLDVRAHEHLPRGVRRLRVRFRRRGRRPRGRGDPLQGERIPSESREGRAKRDTPDSVFFGNKDGRFAKS